MLTTISLALAIVDTQQKDRLIIDPMLIAMAAEVWAVAANDQQTLWPGWDASTTPLLFYMPNEQDVLINHPNPPEGFHKLQGVPGLPFENIYIRNGETLFSFDGQNTTRDVSGVETLVVSDTLSQRRQQLQGLVGAVKAGYEKTDEIINGNLKPNPYAMMGMIAHEAFHAHQANKAPNKGGNELSLMQYPSLSVENNVGYALEAEFLRGALLAEREDEFREAALSWMAVREGRRKNIPTSSAEYEDGIEFSEGLAMSMEYRLYDVLEGRSCNDRMYWAQGFHGYENLLNEKEELIDRAVKIMSGKQNVNNDLYGASPVRMRLYSSGMLTAALIDRISSDWQETIFEEGETLTKTARKGLNVSDDELEEIYKEIQSSERYKELVFEKTSLSKEGDKYIKDLVTQIRSGSSTLVLDVTEWAGKPIGMAMTPFGILRVDDDRRIHRMIPFKAFIGKFQVVASDSRPYLHDNVARQYVIALKEPVTEQFLDENLGKNWRDGRIDLKDLNLPGATLSGGQVTVNLEGKTLTVKIHFVE